MIILSHNNEYYLTIPIEMNKPRVEPSTIHILCVHHSNNNIGNIEQINTLNTIFNNLHIPQVHTQIAPPTPFNIQVNKSKKWNALTYSTTNPPLNDEIPSLPTYENNNHLNSHLNIAIIQTVPFFHHNKLTTGG